MKAGKSASASRSGAEEMIETYYEKGVTDGLPVVPPSRASLDAMLEAGGLRADALVATMASRDTPIMADKVAINAVMAGCRPEYMPVVVAAVKALCDPDFNGHGPATTTGSTAIAIIVNGPIAKTLEINSTDNLFGPGFRANATIGRALRLVMMNVLNCRPGQLDRSTLGNPGKYSLCFAENEEESPWEPLHVERGFRPSDSTVTLYAAIGQTVTLNSYGKTPELILLSMADAMSYLGSHNIMGQGELVLVFPRECTEVFKEFGWDKSRIRRFLFDHAGRSVAELKRAACLPEEIEPEDETTRRNVVSRPEDFVIVAAGGRVGSHAACLPGWGLDFPSRSVTLPITPG
jgi:hypothetical protein